MKKLTKLSLITGATILAMGTAQAADLDVAASVADVCGLNLSTVSSGTLSIAEENFQTVANVEMECNAAGGATLSIQPLHGDLYDVANDIRVNYAYELNVAAEPGLSISARDTFPNQLPDTASINAFSSTLAGGVDGVFRMNVNVDAPGGAPGDQTNFPANAAPAGEYVESFTFLLTGI